MPTRSITVTVPPFESGSESYGSTTQRFSFCMFVQDTLFMPSNETSEKVTSVIVGVGMNGTHIASTIEPFVITFIIPKVKL